MVFFFNLFIKLVLFLIIILILIKINMNLIYFTIYFLLFETSNNVVFNLIYFLLNFILFYASLFPWFIFHIMRELLFNILLPDFVFIICLSLTYLSPNFRGIFIFINESQVYGYFAIIYHSLTWFTSFLGDGTNWVVILLILLSILIS